MGVREFTLDAPQGLVRITIGDNGQYATRIGGSSVGAGTFNDVGHLVRTLLDVGFKEEKGEI